VDANVKFSAPRQPDSGALGRMNDWLNNLFQNSQPAPEMTQPVPLPEVPLVPEQRLPEVATRESVPVERAPVEAFSPGPSRAFEAGARPPAYEMQPRPARIIRRGDGTERIVIVPGAAPDLSVQGAGAALPPVEAPRMDGAGGGEQ